MGILSNDSYRRKRLWSCWKLHRQLLLLKWMRKPKHQVDHVYLVRYPSLLFICCFVADRSFNSKTKQYCSFALLTVGVDQTYSYIACGGIAKTEHFLPSPTAQITPTTKTNDLKVSVTATLSTPTQTGPTQTGSAQTGSTQPPSTSTPGSTTSSATQSFRASIETDSSPAKTTSGNNGGSAVNSGTNNSTGQNDSSPNNVGAIIGGVIGGIALSCIFGIAAIYLLRRNRSNRSNRSRSPQISTPLESNVPLETKDQRYNQRYTGGWMPREMEGSQYERRPNIAVELPG